MVEQLQLDVIARLRAIDPEISPEQAQASWALLTPFHDKAGYTAPRIERDLSYSQHPRHLLDVHTDGLPGAGLAPVFVFVHGGGFVAGDKHTPGTPRHDLVGAWAVRHGLVGVTMTYRLAPEFTWPAGAQDVAAAVGWLRANIADYGGDPDRIVVAGNSAGAVHVADYIAGHANAGQYSTNLDGIRGAALLSGIYQARTAQPGETGYAYYGANPGEATASLPGLLESGVPLLFSVAERDGPAFHAAAAGLVSAWQARHGTMPDLVWVDGHNHMSTIASLTIDEAALGVPLARFIERNTGVTG
jgi:acetyl esterase/lipase